MIILNHTDAYQGALADVRNARLEQLGEFSDLATFIVVEPGDRPEDIQPNPAINLVDGLAFGHPDFVPSFEFCERHQGGWELCFILSDDGFGHIILIPDRDGIDPTLLAFCRQHG